MSETVYIPKTNREVMLNGTFQAMYHTLQEDDQKAFKNV